MPIPVVCSCAAKLRVGDHLKGKHVQCPKCGSLLAVGAANGSAAPPAAPAPPPTSAAVLARSDLSQAERGLLEGQLTPGERVVWAGKPAERVAYLRAWLATFAFVFAAGVLVTILVILLAQGVLHNTGALIVSGIVGTGAAVFLAIGFAWPFWARHRARKTFYTITTRRALGWFCSLLGRVKFQPFEPAEVAGVHRVTLTKGPDDVGHLIFGARLVRRNVGRGQVEYVERWGFFNVPRAAEVERLLRETLIDSFLEQMYDQ
jgi:hypothetical protein